MDPYGRRSRDRLAEETVQHRLKTAERERLDRLMGYPETAAGLRWQSIVIAAVALLIILAMVVLGSIGRQADQPPDSARDRSAIEEQVSPAGTVGIDVTRVQAPAWWSPRP